MGGTGQHDIGALRQLLGKDGAHELIGILLDALSGIEDHGTGLEVFGDLPAGASHIRRRNRKQYEIAVRNDREIGCQGNAVGDFDARQLFLLFTVAAHRFDFLRDCAPDCDVMILRGVEHHSERGAKAAAENRNFSHKLSLL